MAPSHPRILRVGVTGGIGSGKSAVCRALQRRGFTVLSADLLARDISDTNPRIRRQLTRLLGPEAYTSSGALNRPYVARAIFSHRRLQRAVNAIVHPAVRREVLRRISQAARRGARIVVVEAALIYEAGLDRDLDLVVVVDAHRRARISRVMKRDGVPAAEVLRRMRSQMDVRAKRRRADVILRNTGGPAELRASVRTLAMLLSTFAGIRS
jgi:dephospho-CoA kinase